jgi:hypothetical protein
MAEPTSPLQAPGPFGFLVQSCEPIKGAPPSKETEMKLAIGILAVLLIVAALLAAPLIAHRAQPWPDCVSRIVVVKGPDGAPVECVCLQGTLSTCFNPGP